MNELNTFLNKVDADDIEKIVIHSPEKGSEYVKISARPVTVRGTAVFQFEKFTKTQSFHENVPKSALSEKLTELFCGCFRKLTVFTSGAEHSYFVSAKGKATSFSRKTDSRAAASDANGVTAKSDVTPDAHNKEKRYLLPEGTVIPALVDMGVFTKDGKVAASMQSKYRQINRFLEILHDVTKNMNGEHIEIVDFGCGKSYLTFIVYHFLERVCGCDISVTGLDLKKDVIADCAAAAKKYGYKNLRFAVCDIKDYMPDKKPDIVISLHACDTATDYALYNAVKWNASVILSVPCCQKELFKQIKSDSLSLVTRYGIIKERAAALFTDAIRANLLEREGYKTQILEFVDLAHSPKNLLIRAVKSNIPPHIKEKAGHEAESLINEFNLSPTLFRLLNQ